MSAEQPIYAINSPRMVHDTIDNETVMIDTQTGVYFNIRGSGCVMLQILETGASSDTVTNQLAGHYGLDASALRPTVEQFLAELAAESIIVPTGRSAPAPGLDRAVEPYAPPFMKRFTDMEELLLIDPIHEVEAKGWPYRS